MGTMYMNKTKLFVGLIIFLATVLAVTSFWDDSLIVDEIPHIGAGYSYLTQKDMRLNPEHPPLAKDLAALPLLPLKLNQDAFQTESWQKDLNGQWKFGRALIFDSGNNAELITRLVKLPMLLFFIFSAVLVFFWGKKLYGKKASLIALILFSFSPTVLAHSRFVTTDMPALFGVLSATYFFIRWLKNQNKKNFFIAGSALGIALLTKFSTFLLVPFLFALVLIYFFAFRNKLKASGLKLIARFALLVTFAFAVVWSIYGLQMINYSAERQYADTRDNLLTFGNRKLAEPVIWASDKSILRPLAQYGLGLLMVTQRSVGGNTTYFMGEVSRSGWRSYFPIIYLIKEPLAWWGLVLIALLGISTQVKSLKLKIKSVKDWTRNHFAEVAMLLWLAIYWFVSIRSNLNIGVRHLLPIYPFAILLVSGQLARLACRIKKKIVLNSCFIVLAFFLGWYIFENLSVYPYYLTYFNQLVGGPRGGYEYAVDSNLDWGQDLKRLSQWVEENNISKIEFDYFGWANPTYYLDDRYIWASSTKYTDARDFTANNQSDGWLAVSASFLQGSQGSPDQYKPVNYLWLKNHTPVTTIGNSIFVYRIK